MKGEMRGVREERLVECAKRIFASRGYYTTSISEIVQQAGVARGTFYQHFDNKLHIFQSILDSFIQNLRDCVQPISLSPEAPSPMAQVRGNLHRVFDLVLGERDLTLILLYQMHHSSSPEPVLETHLNDFYRRVADMIERSLNQGVAMRLVRPCNTRLTAYSIIGAVKEVVYQITSSQDTHPPVDELVQELLDFGMEGIVAGHQGLTGGNAFRDENPGVSQRSTSGSTV
jgi:AcrR family transcriptional regulator